jgi:hypothetical protein
MILLFIDPLITLLENVINFGIEYIFELSLEHLLLELGVGIVLSDVKKIKVYIQDLVESPVHESLMHFQTAIHHLQVPTKYQNSTLTPHLKKDALNDAKKYFEWAIMASTKVLSLKSTTLNNYILCMQILFLSQLFSENYYGVCASIRDNLKDFIKKKNTELIAIYYYLFFDGSNWDDNEMKLAYVLFRLFAQLRKLKVIDETFISFELNIVVARPILHRLKEEKTFIDITNPRIKFRKMSEKVGEYAIRTTGIVTVPVTFGYGAFHSLLSIALSPLIIPYAAIDSAIDTYKYNETKNSFSEQFPFDNPFGNEYDEKYSFSNQFSNRMKNHLKYNIGAIVTFPRGASTIGMDEKMLLDNYV